MLRERKPSLRHFAVLRRQLRSFRGSTWEVQDRRNVLRKHYLFVPSRMNSWPIWLNRLESLDPTPIRLRNGKVCLLLTSSELDTVRTCLRVGSRRPNVELNALTGFQATQSKRKRFRFVLIPAIATAVLLFIPIPRDGSLATQTIEPSKPAPKVQSCTNNNVSGSEISGPLVRYRSIQVAGQKYKVADFKKLGGLAQIKVKRICDGRYLRFEAWLDAKKLRVERVY